MLGRLRVEGFKRLRNVDFTICPFTVLVGANGVGKTSFLDVIDLLAAAVLGNLDDYFVKHGGFASVLTNVEGVNELRVEFTLDPIGDAAEGVRVRFAMEKQGFSYLLRKQSLDSVAGANEIAKSWFDGNGSADLASSFREATETQPVRSLFAAVESYRSSRFSVDGKAKDPQQLVLSDSPGQKGEYLLGSLYNLREKKPDDFEELLHILRQAFPSFEKLTLPLVANGTVGLQWWEKGLSGPLSSFQLSEGVLRFLWLATAVIARRDAPLLLFDEPEASLHPELMAYLVELLRGASNRTQIVVATQSDSFVRFLDPSELAVFDKDEDGFATLTWADSMDIDGWLEDYTLDGIWRKGVIGGRA